MPPTKRGVSVKTKTEEEEASTVAQRRRLVEKEEVLSASQRVTRSRGDASPEKIRSTATTSITRKKAAEEVRAQAQPVIPKGRGRGRPPSIPVQPQPQSSSKFDFEPPARRPRRTTERNEESAEVTSPTKSVNAEIASTSGADSPSISPVRSPRRIRKPQISESVAVSIEEVVTEVVIDEGEGRRVSGRKRKLTGVAEISIAQSTAPRQKRISRRISERTTEEEIEGIEPKHEEEIEEEELPPEEVLEDVIESDQEALLEDDDHLQGELLQHEQPHHSRAIFHTVHSRDSENSFSQTNRRNDFVDDSSIEFPEAIYEETIEYEGEETVMADDEEEYVTTAKEEMPSLVGENEDDDAPPQLEPESGPAPEEILMAESIEKGQQMMEFNDDTYIRVQSPGGTQYMTQADMDGDMYMDGGDTSMMHIVDGGDAMTLQSSGDLRTVEFNFLDNKHICCGLCGEIVPYELLLTDHLPNHHPDVFGEGQMDLEEIPYETWLKDKLYHEKKSMENGFRTQAAAYAPQDGGSSRLRNTRVLRRVSQVRVNPNGMTLQQLDLALKKKMVEKMGRKVKVSLVDKQHARCGICNAVVSLNKKFEVVHLVRHFNAWHPSTHRCAGTWPQRANVQGTGKPLSTQDFAVVDVAMDAPENLQCIWCGMFMNSSMLAMHFHEVHPDEVEVPKCHLCLQELVINARLMEKFGEDFEIVLPDEHHIRCNKLEQTFSTEAALDRNIERRIRRMQAADSGEAMDEDDEDGGEGTTNVVNRDQAYSNSRMSFGRRNKPKRNFIMPSLRQAIPVESRYVEAISEGQWRCKLCTKPILAAVISAGAIKHYRLHHPNQLEDMQYEICKARLERVSDGCMEFVHPQLIECLICNLTYALHKPYNMCRGIRHLKTKHPEMMPEFTGHGAQPPGPPSMNMKRVSTGRRIHGEGRPQITEYVQDPELINKLKQEYDLDFDKVQTMMGPDGEPIYLLVPDGEEVDEAMAEDIQQNVLGGNGYGGHDDMDALEEADQAARMGEDEEEMEEIDDKGQVMVRHEEVICHEEIIGDMDELDDMPPPFENEEE